MESTFCQVLCFFFLLSPGNCLKCVDQHGESVDWYYVYKLPMMSHSKEEVFSNGYGFVYMDVMKPQWEIGNSSINSNNNAVYNTLQQIYKSQENSIMYLMYNDESPEGKKSERGHTKGVLAFDETSGFWMIHSSPKFPPSRGRSYNWTATDYGQTVLCISFSYKDIENIAKQLLYNEPYIYDYNIPDQMDEKFPILRDIVGMKSKPPKPYFRVTKLVSLAGQTFVSFAKSRHYAADLYDSLVAPTLKSNLFVETWLRTNGVELPSNCTALYKVYKVTHINLLGKLSFKESADHAKWATSFSQDATFDDSKTWSCVGDINRMKSQFHRGGGTVCLQNTAVWKSFNSSIDRFDTCPIT